MRGSTALKTVDGVHDGGAAIRRRTSTEATYLRIKKRILDNEFPPGFQILEQALALRLGVSRTPVREALIRLQDEGLVEVIPRHGMRVLPLSFDDMKEIYEILTSLEPLAAELLTRRNPRAAELAPLVEASSSMAKALEVNDLESWAKADEAYHLRLLALCGNRRLSAMVMACWEQAHRARMFTLHLRRRPERSTREHMAIVAAIGRGDADAARDLYRRHRQRGGRELLSILRRHRLAHV
ncbi:MAG TPA: GntR family transcriptional regulator [Alphaproteobacteria bacterium]|nr:GntR family transcriptional regulator [Alphaproteobacteria bacterium]